MRRPILYGWWYLSIALGFLALAARQMIVGGNTFGIVIRLMIAVGFAALAWVTWRAASRRR